MYMCFFFRLLLKNTDHDTPYSLHYALSQYIALFQMLPFESTINSTSGMMPYSCWPCAFDKVTALQCSALRDELREPQRYQRGPNTIPPVAEDGHRDKRRRMIFSRSMCFQLTLSYAAVSLSCLGHQLARRRQERSGQIGY